MGQVIFQSGNPNIKTPLALPSGYTLLAYIQSSGTQYIDTGTKVSNSSRVVMDCMYTSTKTGFPFQPICTTRARTLFTIFIQIQIH